MSSSRVVVGRVVKAHGVQGDVVIAPTGDDPDRFAPESSFFLSQRGTRQLQVKRSRPNGNFVNVTFAGVSSRNEAESLRGMILYQEADSLPPPPEGLYYHFQLVGLRVDRHDGTPMGTLVRVHDLSAGDLYEVRGESREWMIPARPDVVESVDLEVGVVRLHECEDLLDAVVKVESDTPSKGEIRRRAREENRKRSIEANERRAAERESETPESDSDRRSGD